MFTEKDAEELFKEPWWDGLKNEVLRTVTMRIKARRDGTQEPHGSILCQAFLNLMNDGEVAFREFIPYLSTRSWQEVLMNVSVNLSEKALEVLNNEEARLWFEEFQQYLIYSWKRGLRTTVDLEIFDVATIRALIHEVDLHVSANRPEFFANTFIEWMRDPQDHRMRNGASMAATFMIPRTWKEVLEAVSKHYKEDVSGLDTRAAASFFERFKVMIKGAVSDYWQRFETEPQA